MTTPARRRVVDSHVHIWPEAQPGRPYPWPAAPDPHPVEALLPVLDASGVAAAVQVTPSTVGYDNAYGLEAAELHPDRITVFGRFDPDAPDLRGRLSAWLEHPAALGVRMTFFEAALAPDHPFWAAATELDVAVAVYAPGSLETLLRVVEHHPGLRLIVDHLGLDIYGPEPFREQPLLAELVPFERVRVKISGLVETSAEPFPFRDVHDHLARAVDLFGAERLIWGSNYPVVLTSCGYAESLEFLDACDFLSGDQLDQLLARTFDELVEASACASPS